ncbi:MAG: FliH/SctL family protein [Anaeromyxobacteraceae bacterium]
MATPLARRPHFLAPLPDSPAQPEPVRFAAVQAGAPRPFSPTARPASGAKADPPPQPPAAAPAPAPAPPPPDVEALRREALEKVAGAVEMLRAQAERLAEQARSDALEIAFQVARKILDAELRTGPEALFALVRGAVRRAGDSRRIAIRLAPDDAATLQGAAGKGALDGPSAARIEIVADASLERGDCMVDTDFGQVDGRLGTRLAELRRAVDASSEGAA